MAVDMKIRVEGVNLLLHRLDNLSLGLRNRIHKRAVTKGATVIRKEVRKQTPVGPTGNLKKSVASVIRKYGQDRFVAVIGHSWPEGAHAHLIEYGTQLRSTKSGKSTGRVPPNPFMRRSLNATAEAALEVVRQELAKGLLHGR